MVEFGKLAHNLGTSIDGVRRNIGRGSIVHSQFNQTVAATGRLSSSNPNIHNWERGTGFPIRRIVSSRWKGGKITKGDFSGLEFRVAVELSQDEQGKQDLAEGVDAHERTRRILAEHGQSGTRQDAKADTFKPLYGGTGGNAAQQAYYKFFLTQYTGIKRWHDQLQNNALSNGRLIIPSGRIYKFRGVKRYPSGYVSQSTQIKNYPVQGFATADIVPICAIEAWRLIQERELLSLLINEVHDDIVIDTHPNELDIVPGLLYTAMMKAKTLLKHWYNYELTVDLPVEIQQGPNWLDVEEVML
jgi:DNA polymerase I-like protein with 3'-5' exonuclease and polymerase domains